MGRFFDFFLKKIKKEKFLDSYGLSLNVSPYVGTRESSILSAETRKKMSDSHLGKYSTISEPAGKNEQLLKPKQKKLTSHPTQKEEKLLVLTMV
jgi:hypothetical protein